MLHALMKCNQSMLICSVSESYFFLLLCSYAILIVCWKSDPQKRAKFAILTQQLSKMLEEEAGYLDLSCSLSWKVMEKEERSLEMEEVKINAAKKMELREGDVEDCAM